MVGQGVEPSETEVSEKDRTLLIDHSLPVPLSCFSKRWSRRIGDRDPRRNEGSEKSPNQVSMGSDFPFSSLVRNVSTTIELR